MQEVKGEVRENRRREDMNCPFMRSTDWRESSAQCLKEKCALWCGKDECAIKKIAMELTRLEEK
jgi:hypothetical protein